MGHGGHPEIKLGEMAQEPALYAGAGPVRTVCLLGVSYPYSAAHAQRIE